MSLNNKSKLNLSFRTPKKRKLKYFKFNKKLY